MLEIAPPKSSARNAVSLNCSHAISPFFRNIGTAIKVFIIAATPLTTERAASKPMLPKSSVSNAAWRIWLATSSTNGAIATVNCAARPSNMAALRVSASLAASTWATSALLNRMPSACASSAISFRPAEPPFRVCNRLTPSESNNFIARRTRSDCDPTPCIASATCCMASSSGNRDRSPADSPSSCNAPRASPVPRAASLVRRTKRCSAISIVEVLTPVRSAAWRIAPNASVVTPILSAVLPNASMAFIWLRTIAVPAATPRVPNATVSFATLTPTRPKPLLTDAKAAPVLSSAVIGIRNALAAILFQLKMLNP